MTHITFSTAVNIEEQAVKLGHNIGQTYSIDCFLHDPLMLVPIPHFDYFIISTAALTALYTPTML